MFTESDLFKVHSLTQRGFNFTECLNSIRLDRIKASEGDKLKIILEVVSNYYKVSEEDIKSQYRKMEIVEARRMFCYLSRMFTNKSLNKIGLMINRNHATVLHQFQNIVGYIDIKDKQVLSEIDELTIEYHRLIKLHEKQIRENV